MSIDPLPAKAASTRGQRASIALAILVFTTLSAYLALVIITRVDSIFFPGNEIKLSSFPGGGVLNLPGVESGELSRRPNAKPWRSIGMDFGRSLEIATGCMRRRM